MGQRPTAEEWSARMARRRVFEQASDEEKVAMLQDEVEALKDELRDVKHDLSVERQKNNRVERRNNHLERRSRRIVTRQRSEPGWTELAAFMDQEDDDIVEDLLARLKMRAKVARGEEL